MTSQTITLTAPLAAGASVTVPQALNDGETLTVMVKVPVPNIVSSIKSGAILKGKVSWSITTVDVAPIKFYIDGVLKWQENYAPYVYNGDGNFLDTTTLTDGTHTLRVNTPKYQLSIPITVQNAPLPPAPTGLKATAGDTKVTLGWI